MILRALHLRDFAVAEQVDLELPGGFSAVTGETGAGKSVIVNALALALGARADGGLIRPGAGQAQVEARFDLAAGTVREAVAGILADLDVPFDGELLLRRSVAANGRGAARVNDTAVTVATLARVGELLADIHGQRENLSLLRPAEQLGLLDRFAGLDDQRVAFGSVVDRLREARRRLAEVASGERERARRVAQLRAEAEEIAAAGMAIDEGEALRGERARLAHARQLAEAAEEGRDALEGDEGGALDALGKALTAARRIAAIDTAQEATVAGLEAALDQAAEAVRALRAYRDSLEIEPRRLAQVEERLMLLHDLQRRYGDTPAEVLAYGERAVTEADALEAETASLDGLREEVARLESEAGERAGALHLARAAAAATFSAEVRTEAALLDLPHLHFDVALSIDEAGDDGIALPAAAGHTGPAAFDRSGVDRVELLASFNREMPRRPLARIASGGETARMMLAVKTVLGAHDAVPTLVFDEVDVGVGGRKGAVIGAALARLAATHQVLCITHLPQVAAYAGHHVRVWKDAAASGTTVSIAALDASARVSELAEMLGGDSETNRRSASELLAAVQEPPARTRRRGRPV